MALARQVVAADAELDRALGGRLAAAAGASVAEWLLGELPVERGGSVAYPMAPTAIMARIHGRYGISSVRAAGPAVGAAGARPASPKRVQPSRARGEE